MAKLDIDFTRMFQDMPAAYMVLDMNLCFADMNEAYLEMVGRSRNELLGRYVFDAFPEEGERLETLETAFAKALSGKANTVHKQLYPIQTPGSQMTDYYWTCHHIPVFDTEGTQCGILQRAQNVTEEVKTERMRDVVLQELDHRIKNHLSTISAIARRTASLATTTDTFLGTFEQRIGAMSRTHQLLVDGNWDGLTMMDLINSALKPYCEDDAQDVYVEGADIMLTNAQAQSLGLALHELTTNAAKYGALRDMDAGSLHVRWDADAETRTIIFLWRESGLENVVPPQSTGFGSTILERILPAELNARVVRKFAPDGMKCKITLPLV